MSNLGGALALTDSISADRFYGMPDYAAGGYTGNHYPQHNRDDEIGLHSQLAVFARDFYVDFNNSLGINGPFLEGESSDIAISLNGQLNAATAHIFLNALGQQFPEIEAHNVTGTVHNVEDTIVSSDHIWTEIILGDTSDKIIIDLTPIQPPSESDDIFDVVIGSIADLTQQGLKYTSREMTSLPSEVDIDAINNRYQKRAEEREFYRYLSTQNVFIVGGVATGKTQLSEKLEVAIPGMFAIDVGDLFRVASKAIIEDVLATPQLIDDELLKAIRTTGDEQSVDTFIGLLNRKTALLRTIFNDVDLTREDGINNFTYSGVNIEEELKSEAVESIVHFVAQAPNVRRLVWNWINKYADDRGSVILTGHNITDIDTTKYTIIRLDASPETAASRLISRAPGVYETDESASAALVARNKEDGLDFTHSVLNYLGVEVITTDNLSEAEVAIAAVKTILAKTRGAIDRKAAIAELEMPREDFSWEINVLAAGIRTYGADIFSSIIDEEKLSDTRLAPTEFDLSIQTVIDLCSRDPSEVWVGDNELVGQIVELLENGSAQEANGLLLEAIGTGKLTLNEQLVRESALNQVGRLRGFSTALYNGEFYLPNFSDPDTSPFEHQSPEVTSKGREIHTLDDGRREMVILEKHSGKKITLKRVRTEISKAYAEGFHYLHAGRDDEYEAYGAYVDGSEFPFAWVSYSQVERKYKKEMLEHFSVEPHRVLEMTRAWNSSWSPKNTMSLLFSFAHSEMQHTWQRDVDNGERDKPLAGIVTAINPNLGFRANAFNGVDFGVIGLKPADFTYIIDDKGTTSYMPRRTVASTLGIPESQLSSHPQFARSRFPLLSTNEMLVLFKGTSRYQIQEPLYRIPKSKYRAIS